MEKTKLKVLGLADIRRKGIGSRRIHKGYMFIYSGSNNSKNGVGFILHPDVASCVLDIKMISDRIIRIDIKQSERTMTLVQIYAPCNDNYTEEDKDEFFDDLADVVHKVELNNTLYDFNGKIGPSRRDYEEYMGLHIAKNSDKNGNGQRMLDLCSQYHLFITNTFYEHRDSQIYTWYKWNNVDCKSQIDYILART
ncbi:hypothetical protein BsWGS_29203 [Bradybaena similaris]